MPLNPKGQKIMDSLVKQHGLKKAKQVFFASKNKGTITKVDKARSAMKARALKI